MVDTTKSRVTVVFLTYFKEYKALLYGPVSPGAGRRVVALKFLVGLVAHIRMPPAQHNHSEM